MLVVLKPVSGMVVVAAVPRQVELPTVDGVWAGAERRRNHPEGITVQGDAAAMVGAGVQVLVPARLLTAIDHRCIINTSPSSSSLSSSSPTNTIHAVVVWPLCVGM